MPEESLDGAEVALQLLVRERLVDRVVAVLTDVGLLSTATGARDEVMVAGTEVWPLAERA